jgi:hypothetical protein
MVAKRTEKRQQAKFERKRGLLYLNSINMGVDEWSKKNDPLYNIKGLKRWLLIKQK